MSKILKAVYGTPDKPLHLGNADIPCYVLEDDTRVLVQSAMLQALGMARGSGGGDGDRLVAFANTKALNPHVSNELRSVIERPIRFSPPTGGRAIGYEGTVLVDICDAVLSARLAGDLNPQQKHIAEACEILVRSFAKVGIIALIDEATGYQEVRGREALQKYLDKILQAEARKWTKTFSNDFFQAIFLMKGWSWDRALQGKKPSVIGHYINNYVYARIGPGVLEKLRKLNPKMEDGLRANKFHQYTTVDYGAPELQQRLRTLTDFAKAVGYNWNNWKRMVERAYPKFGDQLSLAYWDDDEDVKE